MNRMLLVLVIVSLGAPAAHARQFFCPEQVLVIGGVPADSPITLRRAIFSSSDHYTSKSEIAITNVTAKHIGQLLVLVNFTAPNGAFIAMPFSTFVPPAARHDAAFEDWLILHPTTGSPRALKRSEEALFYGMSSTVLPACPSEAVVTATYILFADGSIYSRGFESWTAEPYLLDGTYFRPGNCADELTPEFMVTALVDETGGAQVENTKTNGKPGMMMDCIEAQLRHWRFLPRIRQGTPERSHIHMLFRIHRLSRPPVGVPVASWPETLSFVDVFEPAKGRSPDWEVNCGGYRPSTATLKGPALNSEH